MNIDINSVDLNEDYFHFTNIKNVESILNEGLKPMVGAASKMIDDRPNVSISQGAKGIMGIVNSFVFMFANRSISNIPEEFRKYFSEIDDFSSQKLVGKEIACRAMERKLKEEVYFRVNVTEEEVNEARIGGFTGFDVNLPYGIDKSKLQLITENDNVMSAYDVCSFIYEKTKDIEIFRKMNDDFFYMMDRGFPKQEQKETEKVV